MDRGGICVSLGAKSLRELGSKIERAEASEADLIEVRVDFLGEFDYRELEVLLKERLQRCILTCRMRSQGGHFEGSEAQRLKIIDRLIGLQPAYVDIELETLVEHEDFTEKASRNGVNIIVSWHDFDRTPPAERLRDVKQRAQMLGKITKIVTTARHLRDNVTILELYGSTQRSRLIAFCMGELGTISRVLCIQLGSPFTYASLSEEPIAPGQIPIEDLRRLLQILGNES